FRLLRALRQLGRTDDAVAVLERRPRRVELDPSTVDAVEQHVVLLHREPEPCSGVLALDVGLGRIPGLALDRQLRAARDAGATTLGPLRGQPLVLGLEIPLVLAERGELR